ncbi:hypothetical protein B0H66DRAFT_556235 [Apodospora peruviana]|uniref:CorA-like transporter domain-containing protein n=1 Tax=Apodospora peruviana TaxID=516989 RepID=A0AAE0I5R5_9PEZI|nr:hypothetical protein B0H66DRAFT_556235 [Apodospora peruviana]
MATQTTHGGQSEQEEDWAILYNALKAWRWYPSNLRDLQPMDSSHRTRLLLDIKRHFSRTKHMVLLALDESGGAARRRAVERKIETVVFDYEPNSADESVHRSLIRNTKELQHAFGIDAHSKPKPDPISRFIILESFAPFSPRLKTTEELLLNILTYHQVSPHFLNFVSHICHEPLLGLGGPPYSGSQFLKSFSPCSPGPVLQALDRSGNYYQLVLELSTVFDPSGTADDLASEPISNDLARWPIVQSVVYHRFDILNGKSQWIMTASIGDSRAPFKDASDIQASLSNYEMSSGTLDPVQQYFKASLSVLVWLADWSLGEYDAYITSIDEQMQRLAFDTIDRGGDGGIEEITLNFKMFNKCMETLEEYLVALGSNLGTYQGLVEFYDLYDENDALKDKSLDALGLQWMTGAESRVEVQKDIARFRADILSVCNSIEEMIRRARYIKQIGARRESTTHRLLQTADTKTMINLAQLTYIFSTITLLLLPMSVVSTIFSTDIVKFSPGGEGGGSGGFRGNWSGPAAVWWAVVTVIVTSVVGLVGERWRRKAAIPASMWGGSGKKGADSTFRERTGNRLLNIARAVRRHAYHDRVDRLRPKIRGLKVRKDKIGSWVVGFLFPTREKGHDSDDPESAAGGVREHAHGDYTGQELELPSRQSSTRHSGLLSPDTKVSVQWPLFSSQASPPAPPAEVAVDKSGATTTTTTTTTTGHYL